MIGIFSGAGTRVRSVRSVREHEFENTSVRVCSVFGACSCVRCSFPPCRRLRQQDWFVNDMLCIALLLLRLFVLFAKRGMSY